MYTGLTVIAFHILIIGPIKDLVKHETTFTESLQNQLKGQCQNNSYQTLHVMFFLLFVKLVCKKTEYPGVFSTQISFFTYTTYLHN